MESLLVFRPSTGHIQCGSPHHSRSLLPRNLRGLLYGLTHVLQVVEYPDRGWVIAMEHLEMHSLDKYQDQLGEKLARYLYG